MPRYRSSAGQSHPLLALFAAGVVVTLVFTTVLALPVSLIPGAGGGTSAGARGFGGADSPKPRQTFTDGDST